MDEYCDEHGQMIPWDHPLGFRSYMKSRFYDELESDLRPDPENMIFPDPEYPSALDARIAKEGGIDTCYGGFGIDGHFAFNVPPPAGEPQDEAYFELATRIVKLTGETRTQRSVLHEWGY